MGRRLLAAGSRLLVYDLDAIALQAAGADGAATVASPAEAAAAAEVVITMLPHPQATAAAAHDEHGVVAGLQPEALWIEMSSSLPATTLQLAQAAEERHAVLLDAPVSGGVLGAENGTLTIMVGGAPEDFHRAQPVLEVLGKNVFHVGDRPGDGDLAKTINNLLSAVNLTAAAEALALGIRGGLEPERLLAALGTGSGSSQALTAKIPKYVLTGTYDAGFTINQMLKDLRICQDVANAMNVPSFVGSVVHAMWTSFAATGHAEADHTTVAALLADRAGVEIASRP
jgi:3-hydroxyisobutyrate dehydrogenase-like beta-hydroxyacid dehydrogenase